MCPQQLLADPTFASPYWELSSVASSRVRMCSPWAPLGNTLLSQVKAPYILGDIDIDL